MEIDNTTPEDLLEFEQFHSQLEDNLKRESLFDDLMNSSMSKETKGAILLDALRHAHLMKESEKNTGHKLMLSMASEFTSGDSELSDKTFEKKLLHTLNRLRQTQLR